MSEVINTQEEVQKQFFFFLYKPDKPEEVACGSCGKPMGVSLPWEMIGTDGEGNLIHVCRECAESQVPEIAEGKEILNNHYRPK